MAHKRSSKKSDLVGCEAEFLVIVYSTRRVIRVTTKLRGLALDMAISHRLRHSGWSYIEINQAITI